MHDLVQPEKYQSLVLTIQMGKFSMHQYNLVLI